MKHFKYLTILSLLVFGFGIYNFSQFENLAIKGNSMIAGLHPYAGLQNTFAPTTVNSSSVTNLSSGISTASYSLVNCPYRGNDNPPEDSYLRFQKFAYVGNVYIECYTDSNKVVMGAATLDQDNKILAQSSRECSAYSGPDGKGATIQCPTASAIPGVGLGKPQIICWAAGGSCGEKSLEGVQPTNPSENEGTTSGEFLGKLQKSAEESDRGNGVLNNFGVPEEGEALERSKPKLLGDGDVLDQDYTDREQIEYNTIKQGASGQLYACKGKDCITLKGLKLEENSSEVCNPRWCGSYNQISDYIVGGKTSATLDDDGFIFSEGSGGDLKATLDRFSSNQGNSSSGGFKNASLSIFDKPGISGSNGVKVNLQGQLTKRTGERGSFVSLGSGNSGRNFVSRGVYSNLSSNSVNSVDFSKVNSDAFSQNTITQRNSYQSFQRPQAFQQQQKPRSFIQRFAGGNSVVQRLSNFVTGGQADLRNSPEGLQGGGVQPQVIYVTPDFATPRGLNNENFRSIQAIASDISAQTQPTLARVDRFAQTLTAVGGPNAINTENKSFGRIQDLIVEDEAIRSLRVAEEKGNRAKNQVFCKVDETSTNCNERREVKAKEVERESFVEELEKRVLPESAIQHFLAVYDGWVRPSPAPATYATSTLALLNSQGSITEQPYKIVTNGSAFVSWIVDSVSDATTKAVTTLTNLITGGSSKEEANASAN